jgi:DNA polymerase elongation subunit (family B)
MAHFISARKWGNSMLHRYVDDKGDHVEEVNYKPTLYIRDETGKSTGWTDMTGTIPVSPLILEEMKKSGDQLSSYSKSGILYGQPNFELQFLYSRYPKLEPGLHPLCRISFIDIEVDSSSGFPEPAEANYEVDCLCQWDSVSKKFHVFTLCDWSPSHSVLPGSMPSDFDLKSIVYTKFNTERELLVAWLAHWKANPPAILSGWHVAGFDMPYLYNRCLKVLGETPTKALSPFSVVRSKNYIDDFGNEAVEIDIYGVSILDLLDLYRKFTFKPRESYKLGYIGKVEIGEDKLDFGEDSLSHAELKRLNPSRYVDYNIKDVWLTLAIDQKRLLIDLAAFIAQTAKINFTDVYGPVKTWDAIVCNFLAESNRVAQVMEPSFKKSFEGAFVKEVKASLLKWIASFDLASLYPSIIHQWNMCPSTISSIESFSYGDYVDDIINKTLDFSGLPNKQISIAANGVAFETNRKGVLPELVDTLLKKRKSVKKEMLELKKRRQLVIAELKSREIEVDAND